MESKDYLIFMYNAVKIKTWSHKLDGIRVGRIRTFPFSSDAIGDSISYDLVKT